MTTHQTSEVLHVDPLPALSYSPAQFAQATGVSLSTVRRLIRLGRLTHVRMGPRRILIPARALLDVLECPQVGRLCDRAVAIEQEIEAVESAAAGALPALAPRIAELRRAVGALKADATAFVDGLNRGRVPQEMTA
jgi:excisionase family DNA binding protein